MLRLITSSRRDCLATSSSAARSVRGSFPFLNHCFAAVARRKASVPDASHGAERDRKARPGAARVFLARILAGSLALALAASIPAAAQQEEEVPESWSLKPADIDAREKFRLIFITSTKRDATSADIADYNTFVQDAAADGHAAIQSYKDGFRVVGSTNSVDARDNAKVTGTGVPIYWLNGNKVADNYRDFLDGSWDDEENPKNESGSATLEHTVWTGSNSSGTEGIVDLFQFTLSRTPWGTRMQLG